MAETAAAAAVVAERPTARMETEAKTTRERAALAEAGLRELPEVTA